MKSLRESYKVTRQFCFVDLANQAFCTHHASTVCWYFYQSSPVTEAGK